MDQTPFAELAGVDRLVHDPTRLAILSVLLSCTEADFQYLLTVTGLGKSNLSSQLSKLEAAGLIAITKGFEGKTPWTRAGLTREGRTRVEDHWRSLERIRKRSRRWR